MKPKTAFVRILSFIIHLPVEWREYVAAVFALATRTASFRPGRQCGYGLCTGLIALLAVGLNGVALAQEMSVNSLSSQTIDYWVGRSYVQAETLRIEAVGKTYLQNDELSIAHLNKVSAFAITGTVRLNSERSLVRVTLIDTSRNEYLIYEGYTLVSPSDSFAIRNVCRETCVLGAVPAYLVRVELIDASLQIDEVVFGVPLPEARIINQRSVQSEFLRVQNEEIIQHLNASIKAKGLKWVAGETPISTLPYRDKKKLFSVDAMPNLLGAEYYKGGIFEVPAQDGGTVALEARSSAYVSKFDWRSAHGANDPASPYYDGDATGSGWMTSVKLQSCANCWAHAAVGTTEAITNMYFNQHIDFDLAEQELVSCTSGSCVYGGNPGSAMSYIASNGIVDEACFPESGTDEPCANICPNPSERVYIAGYGYVYKYNGVDFLKSTLIEGGPYAFGISSWWHGLVLVGYQTDPDSGDVIWVLKNSWGAGWGENGYGYLKVPLYDIYLTYAVQTPITSAITPHDIGCYDKDGDGYTNWGLSEEKPASCPPSESIKDCDDSDPELAYRAPSGACLSSPAVGDLDFDGDVDRDDLHIILAARNTPAMGANDLRDLDHDGIITVLDARQLVLLCTRPRCAT